MSSPAAGAPLSPWNATASGRFLHPQPSAVSGENPAAPPCSAQQPSLPRGVLVGRATPRPPVKPRHRTVTTPSARTQCLLEWAG
jgi:hypothetical protein